MSLIDPFRQAINPLPDLLINQIAAGEVIDGPSAVVKELVENSLDAGCSAIMISLTTGGLDEIVVSDDGQGILPRYLLPAIKRHSTSKILTVEHLQHVSSLGFRGEALASICSVADVHICSWHSEEMHAWSLAVKAGSKPIGPQPAEGNLGTRISVSSLFYNIPARKRFLKQARSEYLKIKFLVRQFAFAFPSVSFSLKDPSFKGLDFMAAKFPERHNRWDRLFGKRFQDEALTIKSERSQVKIMGWVGGAGLALSNTDNQFLSINNRIINDKSISHAIRMSFVNTIPPGRFPAYGLALSVPFNSIDVNVHPRKLEVRIKNIRELHDVVYAEVNGVLFGHSDDLSEGLPNMSVSYPAVMNETQPSISKPIAYNDYGRPTFVVGNQFFILISDDGVRAIDLKLAWKTLLQLRLASPNNVNSKPLLLPQRLETSEARILLTAKSGMEKIGFHFSDLGIAGEVLRRIPVVCPSFSAEKFLSTLCMLPLRDHELIESISSAITVAIDYGTFDKPNLGTFEELVLSASSLSLDWTDWMFDLDATALTRVGKNGL
jgi:DNA mismatch repair protein MutL